MFLLKRRKEMHTTNSPVLFALIEKTKQLFFLRHLLREILRYIFESTGLFVACISFLLFNKNIDTPKTKLYYSPHICTVICDRMAETTEIDYDNSSNDTV